MELYFNKPKIKLIQLTDCHFVYPLDEQILNEIKEVMKGEQPDIVVFSGDLFYTYHTVDNTEKLIDDFIKYFEQFKVKYTYCFGNHDGELSMLERDIYNRFLTKSQYFFGHIGSDESTMFHDNDYLYRDERIGNFVANIKGSGDLEFKLVLLDSGRYSVSGDYGSITGHQVKYIKEQLGNVKEPILVFFHIALEEHKELYAMHLISGTRRENDCYQKENSGMYKMLESLDVPVYIYCGHDHINDYTVSSGKMTLGITPGVNMEPYNQSDVRGYRVFEIESDVINNTVKRFEGEGKNEKDS